MDEKKTILEVNNVTKQFGGLTAVNDVSLYINKGEIVGLIGSNGAGKTTLFNMIAGVFSPTKGKIFFKRHEIQGLPCQKICQLGVGRTHQIVKPFCNLTVLGNTTVGALLRHPKVAVAKEKAMAVLEFVGLDHRRDVVGANLTLPELKRMEVARALATEPELLLLDEVIAGLNPTESAKMIEIIRKIKEQMGITIIIIEHVMKAIMALSERIYVLNQGTLIAQGSPDVVCNDPEVIKSYLGEKHYVKD